MLEVFHQDRDKVLIMMPTLAHEARALSVSLLANCLFFTWKILRVSKQDVMVIQSLSTTMGSI